MEKARALHLQGEVSLQAKHVLVMCRTGSSDKQAFERLIKTAGAVGTWMSGCSQWYSPCLHNPFLLKNPSPFDKA